MSKLLDMAIDLSQYAHEGQVDKAGQPYFLHVKAVADGVDTYDKYQLTDTYSSPY